MRLYLVATALLIGGLFIAVDPVSAQSSTVSGFVCASHYYQEDACGDNGLSDAQLTFIQEGLIDALDVTAEATTDEWGYYSVSLQDGTYDVTIERKGFETYHETLESTGSNLDFIMQGTRIEQTGTLVGEDGALLEGSVHFCGQDYATADVDEGEFSTSMTAGFYNVEAGSDGYRPHYGYQLFDGTPAEFVLEEIPGANILLHGIITDQNGDPVSGADVSLDQCCQYYEYEVYPYPAYPDEKGYAISEPYPYYGGNQHTQTDALGAFSFKAYEGWYNLYAYKDGYAQSWADGEAHGEEVQADMTMDKFPDKTAKFHGKITDASGDALSYVSIHVQNQQYGQSECSSYKDDKYCSIRIKSDGSFEGMVMPGYSTINVYYNHWEACQETQDGDGSFTRNCGPDYYGVNRVIMLEENGDHSMQIQMQARPSPDAEVNGYVLDQEELPVRGANINFNRLDGYGYAWAEVDQHGSYNLAVLSGYYSVSVYADGYYQWQGNVQINKGSVTPFDVFMTEGESRYGYCCYAYEDYGRGYPVMEVEASSDGHAHGSSMDMAEFETAPSMGVQQGSSDEPFDELPGLGPYSKEARAKAVQEADETPPISFLVLIAGMVGVVYLRRKF